MRGVSPARDTAAATASQQKQQAALQQLADAQASLAALSSSMSPKTPSQLAENQLRGLSWGGAVEGSDDVQLASIIHEQSQLISTLLAEKKASADEQARCWRQLSSMDKRVQRILDVEQRRAQGDTQARMRDPPHSFSEAAQQLEEPLTQGIVAAHLYDTSQVVQIAEDNVRLLSEVQSLTAILAYFFGQIQEAATLLEPLLDTRGLPAELSEPFEQVYGILQQVGVELLAAHGGMSPTPLSPSDDPAAALPLPIQSIVSHYMSTPGVREIIAMNLSMGSPLDAVGSSSNLDSQRQQQQQQLAKAQLFVPQAQQQHTSHAASSQSTAEHAQLLRRIAALEEENERLRLPVPFSPPTSSLSTFVSTTFIPLPPPQRRAEPITAESISGLNAEQIAARLTDAENKRQASNALAHRLAVEKTATVQHAQREKAQLQGEVQRLLRLQAEQEMRYSMQLGLLQSEREKIARQVLGKPARDAKQRNKQLLQLRVEQTQAPNSPAAIRRRNAAAADAAAASANLSPRRKQKHQPQEQERSRSAAPPDSAISPTVRQRSATAHASNDSGKKPNRSTLTNDDDDPDLQSTPIRLSGSGSGSATRRQTSRRSESHQVERTASISPRRNITKQFEEQPLQPQLAQTLRRPASQASSHSLNSFAPTQSSPQRQRQQQQQLAEPSTEFHPLVSQGDQVNLGPYTPQVQPVTAPPTSLAPPPSYSMPSSPAFNSSFLHLHSGGAGGGAAAATPHSARAASAAGFRSAAGGSGSGAAMRTRTPTGTRHPHQLRLPQHHISTNSSALHSPVGSPKLTPGGSPQRGTTTHARGVSVASTIDLFAAPLQPSSSTDSLQSTPMQRPLAATELSITVPAFSSSSLPTQSPSGSDVVSVKGRPRVAATSAATAALARSASPSPSPLVHKLKQRSGTPTSSVESRNASAAYRMSGSPPNVPLNLAFHEEYALPPSQQRGVATPSTSALPHQHQDKYVLVDASKRTGYLHHRSALPRAVAQRNQSAVGMRAPNYNPLAEAQTARPLLTSPSVPYEPQGAGSTIIPAPQQLLIDDGSGTAVLSAHSSLHTQTTQLTHAHNFPDSRTRPLPRQNTVLAARVLAAQEAERFFVLGGSGGAEGFRELKPRIDSRWTEEEQKLHAERAEKALTATQAQARALLAATACTTPLPTTQALLQSPEQLQLTATPITSPTPETY